MTEQNVTSTEVNRDEVSINNTLWRVKVSVITLIGIALALVIIPYIFRDDGGLLEPQQPLPIAETAVPVRTLCLSAHRKYPFASEDAATRERAWDMLQRGLHLCSELGIPIIQTQGHDVYYEPSTGTTWKRYEEAMHRAAEMCRGASVMLGLENADKPSVGSLDQARVLIERTGNPWFQMYPDIGNVIAHGYAVGPELLRAAPHIVAVHIKDARPGEFRRVPFGEGTVPFGEAFAALQEISYQGPFVIEMWNEAQGDAESVIREALAWVRERMGV